MAAVPAPVPAPVPAVPCRAESLVWAAIEIGLDLGVEPSSEPAAIARVVALREELWKRAGKEPFSGWREEVLDELDRVSDADRLRYLVDSGDLAAAHAHVARHGASLASARFLADLAERLFAEYGTGRAVERLRSKELLVDQPVRSVLFQSRPLEEDHEEIKQQTAPARVGHEFVASAITAACEKGGARSSVGARLVEAIRSEALVLTAKAGSVMLSVEGNGLAELVEELTSLTWVREALVAAAEAALCRKHGIVAKLAGELVSVRTLPTPSQFGARVRAHAVTHGEPVHVAVFQYRWSPGSVRSARFAAGALRALRAHGGLYSRFVLWSMADGPLDMAKTMHRPDSLASEADLGWAQKLGRVISTVASKHVSYFECEQKRPFLEASAGGAPCIVGIFWREDDAVLGDALREISAALQQTRMSRVEIAALFKVKDLAGPRPTAWAAQKLQAAP